MLSPLTKERLGEMRRCFRNWNGSAVMEGAFIELLSEVERLNGEAAEVRRLSLELYTETTGPAIERARR